MSADIQTHTSTPVGYYWKPLTFFKEFSVFPCSSQRVSAEIWLFAQHKTYSNKQITHFEAYMLIHYNQQTHNNFNLSFVRRLNTTAKVFKLSTILCSISFFFLSLSGYGNAPVGECEVVRTQSTLYLCFFVLTHRCMAKKQGEVM